MSDEAFNDPGNGMELPGRSCGSRAEVLSRLLRLGYPVPDFRTVPFAAIRRIGRGARFDAPQLLSEFDPSDLIIVRSSPERPEWGGPKPIANIGMCSERVQLLAKIHGEEEAAAVHAEFVQTFAIDVFGLDAGFFDELACSGISQTERLQCSLEHFCKTTGERFPESPAEQLEQACRFMARSWEESSARLLRTAMGAPDDAGLGLIVQRMASGLLGPNDGSGRATAIDRLSGDRVLSGSYSFREPGGGVCSTGLSELAEISPGVCARIEVLLEQLRVEFEDDREVEFSLEGGNLWLIGTRPAPRSPRAAIRSAVELTDDGLIDESDALLGIAADTLAQIIHPQVDPDCSNTVLAKGIGASPGAVSGAIVFSSAAAEQCRAKGESCILVRVETGPEDIRGMHTANGVLTGRGGLTSHAAVMARGLGVPCVAGASDLLFDAIRQRLISNAGRVLREGDTITVDGARGVVLDGVADLIQPNLDSYFDRFLKWADKHRSMDVRANADTLDEVRVAAEFKADGIGLCRTEHMFFEEERLTVMQEMIFAESPGMRRQVLDELLPMQRNDFMALLTEMSDRPVCIRLFDPPLHEFLPRDRDEIANLAIALNLTEHDIASRADELKEFNPMLGMRGVRLGIVLPEIYEMQARAIFEATVEVGRRGIRAIPEIMIPLVSANREVELVKLTVEKVAASVRAEVGIEFEYRFGLMVETPRAALRAGDLAINSEFLSFGTNDLTQLTYGISRDDSNRFMNDYVERKVFPEDPFCSLDLEGVGELLVIAAGRGRQSNPSITLAICGEHGGDSKTIEFCRKAGFNYVSCSPYRVPIARLATAQSAIRARQGTGDKI